MQRWKLIIEYKGTDYHGWQRQEDAVSIQQAIEEAIEKFCQQSISITAAGRTDAGVHALGQVAHFDLDYGTRALTGFDLAKAINAHLRPQPISIIQATPVATDFHARFSAKMKLYRYRILCRSAFPAVEQNLIWHVKRELNASAMHDAAQVLIGHHDFTTFRDSNCQAKSPMKTLERLDVTRQEYDSSGGYEIIIEARGQSFLHHQVRNMVGSLALVGEGKWSAADLKAALEARDRTAGGMTAPADGLYLVQIDY